LAVLKAAKDRGWMLMDMHGTKGGKMLRKHLVSLFCAGLAAVLVAGASWADGFKDLSAQQLKAKMNKGGGIVVVNPLSDIEFNEGHIPGSVNIPLHQIAATDKLPPDKTTPIVTYCLGPK
jgi:hypothetical protein